MEEITTSIMPVIRIKRPPPSAANSPPPTPIVRSPHTPEPLNSAHAFDVDHYYNRNVRPPRPPFDMPKSVQSPLEVLQHRNLNLDKSRKTLKKLSAKRVKVSTSTFKAHTPAECTALAHKLNECNFATIPGTILRIDNAICAPMFVEITQLSILGGRTVRPTRMITSDATSSHAESCRLLHRFQGDHIVFVNVAIQQLLLHTASIAPHVRHLTYIVAADFGNNPIEEAYDINTRVDTVHLVFYNVRLPSKAVPGQDIDESRIVSNIHSMLRSDIADEYTLVNMPSDAAKRLLDWLRSLTDYEALHIDRLRFITARQYLSDPCSRDVLTCSQIESWDALPNSDVLADSPDL